MNSVEPTTLPIYIIQLGFFLIMCPVVTSTMCTKLEHIKVHDYSELINILNCNDLWKKLGQHLGYCEDDIERFSLYKGEESLP